MDYTKHSIGNPALLLLFFVGFLYLCIWSSSFTSSFNVFRKESLSTLSNTTDIYVPQDDLEQALSKASMANKTVIITMINKAYADQDIRADTTMLDLFLESFWLGEDTRSLLDNLLIVAVDQTAYDRCLFLRLNCYRLETDGVDFGGEKVYMSEDFIKMMWRRTQFLIEVLKRGYSFIFTDTDVMWLRNPLARLSKNETDDLQISTDEFLGLKEQDVLLNLIQGGISRELNLSVRFLDTLYFSGFCQDSKDLRAVTTVHANCCRSITAKVNDLKAVLRDWKRFKKYTSYKRLANVTASLGWTGHFGCWKSWSVATKNIG
uniref:Nucleotide-diphospho-sugar transferase domain-containing protein n=1 Tax=Fagus sylvatica TaxID=28930 RepID=A0A2N9EFZ0_FAGSY